MDTTRMYMSNPDNAKLKEKQTDFQQELRHEKRTKNFITARKNEIQPREWLETDEIFAHEYSPDQLTLFLPYLFSTNDEEILFAAQGIRKILSAHKNISVESLLDHEIVLPIQNWLQRPDFPQLQYETAWIISNLALGDENENLALVSKGLIPAIINLLKESELRIKEQIIWAVGNISATGAELRTLIIQNNGLEVLSSIIEDNSLVSIKKPAVWALGNLTREKIPFYSIKETFLALLNVLNSESNKEMILDAILGLECLVTSSEIELRDLLIESESMYNILNLTESLSKYTEITAVSIIGWFLAGSENQCEHILDLGVVSKLTRLLSSTNKIVRKQATWAISNICAGTNSQLQLILAGDTIQRLVYLVTNDVGKVKEEAIWALVNASFVANAEQIHILLEKNTLEGFCVALEYEESKFEEIALEAIDRMLNIGMDWSRNILVECGGLNKLESLELHENEKIYNKALEIIETHFECEPEDYSELTEFTSQLVIN